MPTELPSPNLVTYQQFAQDLYNEVLLNADKYKTKNQNSSVLLQGQWMEAVEAAP